MLVSWRDDPEKTINKESLGL